MTRFITKSHAVVSEDMDQFSLDLKVEQKHEFKKLTGEDLQQYVEAWVSNKDLFEEDLNDLANSLRQGAVDNFGEGRVYIASVKRDSTGVEVK